MKKTILFLSLSFLLLSVKTQISLDHTFNLDFVNNFERSRTHVEYFILNNEISFYILSQDFDTQITLLKIYNPDFSLRNSCSFDGNIFAGIQFYFFSQKLFNDDGLIEFVVQYMIESELVSYIVIYNENGEIIRKFSDVSLYSWPKVAQYHNQAKLVIQYADKAEIYSLPGTIPNNISENTGKSFSTLPPYPNPSYSYVNLPYRLDAGQTSIMSIYNINGQLIEIKNIDAYFNVIKLNVENYNAGVYIYEYNGISNKFIVE